MPSLPNYVFIDDSTLARRDLPNVIRSETEAGPQKTRKIQSVAMFQVKMDISICVEKLSAFRSWYHTDLGSGAYWFMMNDPFDGTRRRFRFVEYDQEWIKAGNLLRKSITLEAYDDLQ